MNHEQSTSLMATTRRETTHGLTYSVAKAIEVNHMAICQCCLSLLPGSQFLCWSHWSPNSSDYSTVEATSTMCKRRWLECCHLSMPSPCPAACAAWDQPVCSMLIYYSQAWLTVPVCMCVHFCDIMWPEVQ